MESDGLFYIDFNDNQNKKNMQIMMIKRIIDAYTKDNRVVVRFVKMKVETLNNKRNFRKCCHLCSSLYTVLCIIFVAMTIADFARMLQINFQLISSQAQAE